MQDKPASNRQLSPRVYYNSACPVCNAGVRSQRDRMAACGITDVEWIDVHNAPDAVAETGDSLETVRERLYVRDSDGRFYIGMDAFIYLWDRTPGQRWLAVLFRLPGIRQFAHFTYNRFARGLYRWNRRRRHW